MIINEIILNYYNYIGTIGWIVMIVVIVVVTNDFNYENCHLQPNREYYECPFNQGNCDYGYYYSYEYSYNKYYYKCIQKIL